jgi:transcriptional regulator with XRE-family HTH domain
MGRHAHPALAGMDRLGARLRELRQQANVSQTELARRLGFDPTHGYKYVLRLEKGLVPNPTLRTLAGFLEACGATWDRVTDVLPPTTAPASAPAAPARAAPAAAAPPEVAAPPVHVRRRDSRPLREQLRGRRMQEQEERAHTYWTRITKVEDRVRSLLRASRILSTSHRAYLAVARHGCALLEAPSSRPGVSEQELLRQVRAAEQSGLDRATLEQIQAICLETFRPSGADR